MPTNVAYGNLGFTATFIQKGLSLLMPALSLPISLKNLTTFLLQITERSATQKLLRL